MTGLVISDTAKKNHPGLTAYAARVAGSLPGAADIHIVTPQDAVPPAKGARRLIELHDCEHGAILPIGKDKLRIATSPRTERAAHAALIAASVRPGDPVAADSGTIAMLHLADRVAQSEIPVVIEGPTGTGKEVIARYIHNRSSRADGPFIALNCAAVPESMLEAMLFGHRKGAFTGASEAAEGFFRAADKGTLLLDELGEMPLGLQAKLLRVLQEGEVVPLGATKPIPVDVRIIACTNRDLRREIEDGRFREDLYFRLNVFSLQLEALRVRTDDIAPIAFAMLLRHAPDPARIPWLHSSALAKLERHSWPGNVREMENVIRRALVMAGPDEQITAQHILFDNAVRAIPDEHTRTEALAAEIRLGRIGKSRLTEVARQSEAKAILQALADNGGNRQSTARTLGISERTLRYRLAEMRDAGLAMAGGAR
ncbi:sigma-54 interaction domain-containing protein [Erythrobacter sp. EC-HK427]|uniref:sigma-54 interaction domain-containing protein n=1 Tax=Erythrobacter sp. EC-HK427 TaxID=2038396 RepID=UPI00125992A6|nr:sigma 54-interacting transcriptional regulator [Erythrobacter sp. EC-HK427]VVT01649.1 conserved hypothetical protein [Erythrobacter sp. EC-HK427]